MSNDNEYFKLVTNNYNNINVSDKNYCVSCFGIDKTLEKCLIDKSNIYWINDKNGYTGSCKKCFVDSIIPGNFFKNKNEKEIYEYISKYYNEKFTIYYDLEK